jgi:hypothetical protein
MQVRYVHKKQSGGSGQFADVAIRFEPGESGTGFEFKSEIKGGTVPKEYIPGVLKVRACVACLCESGSTHFNSVSEQANGSGSILCFFITTDAYFCFCFAFGPSIQPPGT